MDVVIGSFERLATGFRESVSALAAQAIGDRQRFALAIPGGSVLERLIEPLVEASIEWPSVDLFWCDERCVPSTDPDSNYAAARRLLLDRLAAAGKGPRVHRMRGEHEDPPFAARLYANDLEATLGTPPSVDLVVLGIGEDGHVASLFPGHRSLHEMADWVVVEPASPKPPPARLTITLPLIAAARHVVLAAFGGGKATIVRDVLEGAGAELPASMALRASRRCTVYLDDAAAAMLRK